MEQIPTNEVASTQMKEAAASDIPTLLELEKSVESTKTYSPMLEVGEWEQAFRDGKVYIIERNGETIGNISYELKGDGRVYISGLVIKPEYQGQGIAREVLTDLTNQFKDAKRIDLVTHPDNHTALRLYESLGFKVEKRIENYYGDGEPRLMLVKETQ